MAAPVNFRGFFFLGLFVDFGGNVWRTAEALR